MSVFHLMIGAHMQPSTAPARGMVPRLWEEHHDFYHSSWKSMRMLIHLDLGASEVAPLQSHSLRLQARIVMRAPKPDGLRSPAEAEALFALEDLLTSHLRRELNALYVGRIIGGGELTLVWYVPGLGSPVPEPAILAEGSTPQDVETLSRVVSDLAGGYTIRLSQALDPAWSFYFDFLFPDVYNLQVMLNRRRLLVLADHGDDGSRPRLVDHQARFPTLKQAEEAMRRLAALGYEVDEPERDPETGPDPRSGLGAGSGPFCTDREEDETIPWLLSFGRRDSLSEGRIDVICTELLDVILLSSGHYEGWGTEMGGAAP